MADEETQEDRQEREAEEAHGRFALPLLIPALVFLFAVLVVYGLSRIYLELDTYEVGNVSMATPLAIGVSLLIMFMAGYMASRRTISVFQILGIFLIGAGLLAAGGIWAAVNESSTDAEVHDGTPPPDDSTPPSGDGIQVGLHDPDWAVTTDPPGTGPGPVTFVVTNEGSITHNFRVISTDLEPGGLPVTDDFQVDEAAVDVVAEGAEVSPDGSYEVVADLVPGPYVLICNVAGHYESGMYTGFTVE